MGKNKAKEGKKKRRTEIPNKPQWPAADNANCLSAAL